MHSFFYFIQKLGQDILKKLICNFFVVCSLIEILRVVIVIKFFKNFFYRQRFPIIAVLALIWLPEILLATGLTIYSYQDNLGQTIIVDSLEKIPAQYRKHARKEFISAFKPRKKKDNHLTFIEALPDSIGTSTETHQTSMNKPVQIISPPDENYQVQLASASAFMEIFSQIQLDTERMYIVAKTFGLKSPLLHQLHLSNVNRMNRLEQLRKLKWPTAEEWLKMALEMYERYKIQQYTISKWLRDNPNGLKHGLLELLQVNSLRLQQLKQAFSRLKDIPDNAK